MTTTLVHVVVSVDIDRFTDRQIERLYLPMFAPLGAKTPADVRRICREARAEGLDAFPNAACDNYSDKGHCLGHPRAGHPKAVAPT